MVSSRPSRDGVSEAGVSIVSLMVQMNTPRLRALFAQDPTQAAEWVYVVAAEGLPAAQVCYGRMLLEGTGIAKDAVSALRWFRRAAVSGDADAINMVGRCLDNGWGTAEDPVAAAVEFVRAADAGHAWAQYNAGHMFLDGRGVARDRDRAFAYYSMAAAQNHERAMNLLGRCCEEGWGTPRDLRAAAAWYRRSAEGGYFRGQYNWASVLLKAGRDSEAAHWFECALAGGTSGVREAVLGLVTRLTAGGPGAAAMSGAPNISAAMQRLADRLRADDALPASP
jgi:TPR repeat protein